LLPRSTEAVEDSDAGEIVPTLKAAGTVLVVDDDAAVAAVTLGLLADLGYEVHRASSAVEALDILDSGRHFDAVVSDIVMAGSSGIELAKTIARVWPGLPVILATGYAEAVRDPTVLAWRLLHKPYTQEQLGTALTAVMAARPAASAVT
jgi:CheY-like chemotaxis protein